MKDYLITLIEKRISRLESRKKLADNMARHCFINDYDIEYELWDKKRKEYRTEIICLNTDLDMIYNRIKRNSITKEA
tara:strand:+ start:340 stop:570 length:231 start_codon:yes stop_codon:yes gene_type:complete